MAAHQIPSQHMWKTRDGRVIPLPEMTDRHIANALQYIRLNKGFRPEWTVILQQEQKRRQQARNQKAIEEFEHVLPLHDWLDDERG